MSDKRSPPYGNTLKIDAEELHLRNNGVVTPEIMKFYEDDLDTIILVVDGQNIIFRRTAY